MLFCRSNTKKNKKSRREEEIFYCGMIANRWCSAYVVCISQKIIISSPVINLKHTKERIMNKKHQVHNLIILDESGSMESIKKNIIQGFNEIVQTVKGIEKEFLEQEHFISLISFNGLGQKLLHFIDPVSRLELIDETRYTPDASTPL